MRKGIKIGIVVVGLTLLLSPFLLILIGNYFLHDFDISEREDLISDSKSQLILAFFPHPDDEITVAGTLRKLVESGHEVHLLCLTKGEACNTDGELTKNELAAIRALEMAESARIIGVEKLHLLSYADSGLRELGLDSLKSIAYDWIRLLEPEILISYDSEVGLYGHEDHRLTGLALEELFLENRGRANFSPQSLYQVTLSPKQIQVALKLSSGFQKNYPSEKGKGLPKPDFSIDTQKEFPVVLSAMKAHESQTEVLRDLMPYHDQIPLWIYSRIFGKEYFRQVK